MEDNSKKSNDDVGKGVPTSKKEMIENQDERTSAEENNEPAKNESDPPGPRNILPPSIGDEGRQGRVDVPNVNRSNVDNNQWFKKYRTDKSQFEDESSVDDTISDTCVPSRLSQDYEYEDNTIRPNPNPSENRSMKTVGEAILDMLISRTNSLTSRTSADVESLESDVVSGRDTSHEESISDYRGASSTMEPMDLASNNLKKTNDARHAWNTLKYIMGNHTVDEPEMNDGHHSEMRPNSRMSNTHDQYEYRSEEPPSSTPKNPAMSYQDRIQFAGREYGLIINNMCLHPDPVFSYLIGSCILEAVLWVQPTTYTVNKARLLQDLSEYIPAVIHMKEQLFGMSNQQSPPSSKASHPSAKDKSKAKKIPLYLLNVISQIASIITTRVLPLFPEHVSDFIKAFQGLGAEGPNVVPSTTQRRRWRSPIPGPSSQEHQAWVCRSRSITPPSSSLVRSESMELQRSNSPMDTVRLSTSESIESDYYDETHDSPPHDDHLQHNTSPLDQRMPNSNSPTCNSSNTDPPTYKSLSTDLPNNSLSTDPPTYSSLNTDPPTYSSLNTDPPRSNSLNTDPSPSNSLNVGPFHSGPSRLFYSSAGLSIPLPSTFYFTIYRYGSGDSSYSSSSSANSSLLDRLQSGQGSAVSIGSNCPMDDAYDDSALNLSLSSARKRPIANILAPHGLYSLKKQRFSVDEDTEVE